MVALDFQHLRYRESGVLGVRRFRPHSPATVRQPRIRFEKRTKPTRLAPDIIRAILEGRQPRHLNLHAMRGRQAEVPLDWDAQRKLFEFIPPKG